MMSRSKLSHSVYIRSDEPVSKRTDLTHMKVLCKIGIKNSNLLISEEAGILRGTRSEKTADRPGASPNYSSLSYSKHPRQGLVLELEHYIFKCVGDATFARPRRYSTARDEAKRRGEVVNEAEGDLSEGPKAKGGRIQASPAGGRQRGVQQSGPKSHLRRTNEGSSHEEARLVRGVHCQEIVRSVESSCKSTTLCRFL